jgi:hypothetical protein
VAVLLENAGVDLDISKLSTNSSALEVACPRRELERKIEIVLLEENAWMELKSSANESWRLPGSNAPSFIAIQTKMAELWSKEDPKKDRRKIKEQPESNYSSDSHRWQYW